MVDHVEMPADPQAPEAQHVQSTRLYLAPDSVRRHEGDSEACHDRLLDRLGMVELHRGVERDAGAAAL